MSDITKNKKYEYNVSNNEIEERKNKFFNMIQQGLVLPDHFTRNTNINKIHKEYQKKDINELKQLHIYVSIAGRMIQKRIMGKASFFTLYNIEGTIQIYVNEKNISSNFYNNYFKKLDLGDIVGVIGTLFKTKTGELSIYCDNIKILAKALKPLPNKFHGLSNQEIRYRKRYLDLISNNQLFKIFKYRSKIISEIRNFMKKNDFLEVETPMLQSIPGGANARPFITYHNEMHTSMYLRIAPELYLKKLIIGGFERIFELNKNFRNEGVSSRHNPEFTMMEAYIAYANYEDMMKLTEEIFKYITTSLFKKNQIIFHNHEFDFSKPFHRLTMKNAILKFNKKIRHCDLQNFKKIKLFAESIGITVKKQWTIGHIENEIFEKTVEHKLIHPTFITQYPVEVSPLARRNNIDHNTTDRFELFISGYEIANGFSELNDAEDQKNRFLQQIAQSDKKDNDTTFYDKDYIEALNYGLPPTSGLGIGIDRLIMVLTNQSSIRDVILFPTLRSLNK